MIFKVILIFSLVYLSLTVNGEDYSYNHSSPIGPPFWGIHFPNCYGSSQSPINIDTSRLVRRNIRRAPLHYINANNSPVNITLKNKVHALDVAFHYRSLNDRPRIVGGDLNGEYILNTVHFHFGDVDGYGSEHTVNGHAYPLEIHITFFSSRYTNFDEAIGQPNGVTVIGLLPEIDYNRFKKEVFPFNNKMHNVINPNDEYHFTGPTVFRFSDLIPQYVYKNYVSYMGSLTTPPCSEGVHWILPMIKLSVSWVDMYHLRKLLNEDNERMAGNYRPIQELNGRTLYQISCRLNDKMNDETMDSTTTSETD